MTQKVNNPFLLTVREVSELLRIHRPKVYVLIKSGGIEGFKVGSDWRIRRDSVEKLIGPIPEEFFKKKKKRAAFDQQQPTSQQDDLHVN